MKARKEERPVFFVAKNAESIRHLISQVGHFGFKAMIIEAGSAGKGKREHVPVVFISESGSIKSRLEAVHAGGSAYFTEPVDVSELVDKLDVLIAEAAQDPYRVLIVDSEKTLAAQYAKTLKEVGMKTEVAAHPMQISKPLVDFNPDLILMNRVLPECSGLDLAQVLRQEPAYVGIPIVFISKKINFAKEMKAIRLGGDDLLVEPITHDHLISSVMSRAQRSRTLQALAMHDGLTGLLNHTNFKARLELEIERAKRYKNKLAYVILDMDDFKSVNDRHGHMTGDRVLKSLARLLQQRLRKTDILGRYGGDEFAAILLDATEKQAADIFKPLQKSFSELKQQGEKTCFACSFSFGVAGYPAHSDFISLGEAADKALYKIKRKG